MPEADQLKLLLPRSLANEFLAAAVQAPDRLLSHRGIEASGFVGHTKLKGRVVNRGSRGVSQFPKVLWCWLWHGFNSSTASASAPRLVTVSRRRHARLFEPERLWGIRRCEQAGRVERLAHIRTRAKGAGCSSFTAADCDKVVQRLGTLLPWTENLETLRGRNLRLPWQRLVTSDALPSLPRRLTVRRLGSWIRVTTACAALKSGIRRRL